MRFDSITNNLSVDSQISRDLISAIIEKALCKISRSGTKIIEHRLKQEYGYNFSDCLSRPQSLKSVLSESFGIHHQFIIDSIEEELQKCDINDSLYEFLTVLKQK